MYIYLTAMTHHSVAWNLSSISMLAFSFEIIGLKTLDLICFQFMHLPSVLYKLV